MSQLSLEHCVEELPLDPIDIVRDILREVESLPRLMEVHYLMQEPGLPDPMRGLGALEEGDRKRLNAYLARHRLSRLRVRDLSAGALILEALDPTRRDESA